MTTAAKERVIETASTKPMSRRALAIAANVGYSTITKMIEAGELDFNNKTVSAKKGKSKPDNFALEVFENGGRGIADMYLRKPTVSVRSAHCNIGKNAADKMGVNNKHKMLLSINPATRSVHIGLAPKASKLKGYAATKQSNVLRFHLGRAKDRVPKGLYEVVGEGRQYLGATWFELSKAKG